MQIYMQSETYTHAETCNIFYKFKDKGCAAWKTNCELWRVYLPSSSASMSNSAALKIHIEHCIKN